MILIPILLMLVAYWSFSILLFFFPTILHKYRKHHPLAYRQALAGLRVLRIAHRGGPRATAQNTIQAFKKVLAVCDILEMDVCQTKDGTLVVHHDHDLQRTCGIKGFIRDYNYSDLPRFKQKIQLNFAAQGQTIQSNNQKIPTLQEVFNQFPKTPMNIQLKTPSDQAISNLIKMLKTHKRRHLTIVGVRGQGQLQLQSQDVQTQRFINDNFFAKLAIAYFTGFLPFLYIQEASVQLPLFTEEFYAWKVRQWGDNWKTHWYFKGLKIMNIIFKPFMHHLRKRGILTFYWVCNNEEQYQRAIDNGACGIMTDDCFLLDKFIKEKYGELQQPVQQNQKQMSIQQQKSQQDKKTD